MSVMGDILHGGRERGQWFYGAALQSDNTKQLLHALLHTQRWVHKSLAKQDCGFSSRPCCCTVASYIQTTVVCHTVQPDWKLHS